MAIDREGLKKLAQELADLRAEQAPPRLRLITAADLPPKPPALYTDTQREWVRDRIRMWTRVYVLEQWTRQQMKGFATLEEMPDEELHALLDRVEKGVELCREGIGFDEAGLM